MDKNSAKTTISGNDPASVRGAHPYEEGLKDYSKTGSDDAIDNLPDSNPEPSPAKNTTTEPKES